MIDLTRWLHRSKAEDDQTSGDTARRGSLTSAPPGTIEQPTEQDLKNAEAQLLETEAQLRRARAELLTLDRKEERTRARLAELRGEYGPIESVYRELTMWMGRRSGSYAWRLSEALEAERVKAQAEEEALRAGLQQALPVRSRVLNTMRVSFHRIVAVMTISLIVFWVVAIAPRYRYPQVMDVTVWWNVMAWPIWQVFTVGAVAFILGYVLALLAYHRRWSYFSGILRLEHERNSRFRSTLRATREEQQRLEVLHAQVPTYLAMLSEVIHRPWIKGAVVTAVAGSGTGDPGQESHASTLAPRVPKPDPARFPHFMRIAETPSDAGGPAVQELVRLSIGRVLQRNWRLQAYGRLLRCAEIQFGLPAGTFTPEAIDRDPRSRDAFLESLRGGEAQKAAYLEMLREVSQTIQAEFMDRTQPRVRRIDPDPLEGLDLSLDVLEGDVSTLRDWNEFLLDALADANPWTPFLLRENVNERIDSLVIKSAAWGPSRLGDEASELEISYNGSAATRTGTLEIMVRIDTLQRQVGPEMLHPITVGKQGPTPGVAAPVSYPEDQAIQY